MEKCYRQGELVFIPVDMELKPDEKTTKKGNLNIREGEMTGHIHRALEGELWLKKVEVGWRMPEREDMYLVNEKETKIVHDEHAPLTLPKGKYFIRIQREYDEENDRQVAD